MIKINKRQARKLYNKGITIWLTPCKCIYNSMLFGEYKINKATTHKGGNFDSVVNCYEYYNCNYNETGLYCAYYILDDYKYMFN